MIRPGAQFGPADQKKANVSVMDAVRDPARPDTAVASRATPPPIAVHRAIFLSDMHLGTRMSRPDLILDFLNTNSAETVYLVGDIIDTWHPLSKNWTPQHHEVMRRLFALPHTGTRVVYLPGNHDAFFRNYAGTTFGGVEVEREVVHLAADGRRYLVTHGDRCDVFSARAPLLARAGSLVERSAHRIDRGLRWVLRILRQPEWLGIERSIARTNAAIRRHDRFEERLVRLAQAGGHDGIVCGHFHQPALHDRLGTVYANCGDWLGRNSAIVEGFDGRLKLLTPSEVPLDTAVLDNDAAEGDLAMAL